MRITSDGEKVTISSARIQKQPVNRLTRDEVLVAISTARAHQAPVFLFNLDLKGVNLTGVDLQSARLTDTDLTGANLTDVNLTDADLIRANLHDANLEGANLSGAKLWSANLEGANLEGANLSGAELYGASLTPSALTNFAITDKQWATAKVGPTRMTGDRLNEIRVAATTTDLAELKKHARATAIGVRMAAASNKACPEELLMKLISDKREEVRRAVLTNPNCTDEMRVMMALQS
jgi:uncharacterized protein YjbI with pentapeptide repeats